MPVGSPPRGSSPVVFFGGGGVNPSGTSVSGGGANPQPSLGVVPINVKDSQYGGGAIGDGVADDTLRVQAAITAAASVSTPTAGGATVFFPPGTYKITAPLVVNGSIKLLGSGLASTVLRFWGCNGIAGNAEGMQIEDIQLFSLSGAGAADPKLYDGISINGTAAVHIGNVHLDNVFLRGWANCIHHAYGWSSTFRRIYTVNCLKGYRSFGESANNAISDCVFLADTRAVALELDGAFHAEGLHISNCVLASAGILLYADQVIGLDISSCIMDLGSNIGVSLTNCTGSIVGGWIYAQNDALRFEDLGAITQGNFRVIGASIWSVTARAAYIGAFNRNVVLVHNKLQWVTAPIAQAANAKFCITWPNTSIDGGGNVTRLEGGVSQLDADVSFVIGDGGLEFGTIYFNVALAAGRTLTLPTRASCWNGRKFRIRRALGAGTLTIQEAAGDGGAVLKVLPAAALSSADVEFAGALGVPAWILTNYSVL